MPVTLQLAWKHQFQFAGFYMAKEKGFYQDEGIDVTFLEHNHNDTYQDVVSRKVDFAVLGPSVVSRYLDGLPIVALGVIFQQTPHVWLSLASKRINNRPSLVGKRFSITTGYEDTELTALLWKIGLAKKDVIAKNVTYGVDDLLNDRVDLINAYIGNEPYKLIERDIDFRTMSPLDYGMDFYGDVLFTSKALAEESPELVDKFRKASFKGWEYVFNNIDESVELVYDKYNGSLHKSRDALLYEARQLTRLSYYPMVDVGTMNLERWKRNAKLFNPERTVVDGDLEAFLFHGNDPLHRYKYMLYVAVAAASLFALWAIFNFVVAVIRGDLARTDHLTKLGNRKALTEKLAELVSRYQRYKSPVSILMLDIDHFKQVNDTYGHQEGDNVLKALSHEMQSACRTTDFLYRFGGEEFIVVLPETTWDHAVKCAEKLRKDVQENVHITGNGPITISIGVAEMTQSDDADSIVERADANLYRAKQTGRNKVVAQ